MSLNFGIRKTEAFNLNSAGVHVPCQGHVVSNRLGAALFSLLSSLDHDYNLSWTVSRRRQFALRRSYILSPKKDNEMKLASVEVSDGSWTLDDFLPVSQDSQLLRHDHFINSCSDRGTNS